MSTVIENQIVQMQFDNKEFEKNISASMHSLDDFKEKMDFDDSEKSFKSLEKASEEIDFDKLNKAIDGVGEHFTVIGRTFYKVTDEIANYFTSKITGAINAVKSVTTDIIDPRAGYSKYDQYVHGVKNILAALSDEELARLEKGGGKAIDAVEEKLEELMAYTDETSYNFVDMVSTIGKFLGNGINLDDSIAAMQGIANWAALSGQNATTASQAMYQMSQALGAGYVKYQDWTQMANLKSMGTTQAKDVFIEAAKQVGTITEKDLKHAREVLGKDATEAQIRNWFFEAEQLNKESARWFTTDVLKAGLSTFSSVSNEVIPLINSLDETSSMSVTQFLRLGKEMKKTGKTAEEAVTGLLDDGKISLTNDEYKKIVASLKKVTSEEYKVGWNALLAAQEATTFSEAIEATKDAASTGWLNIFRSLIGNYEEAAELWTDLSNSLYNIFVEPFNKINVAIGKWAKESSGIFDDTGKELTKRQALWTSIGNALMGVYNIFSSFASTIMGWTGSVGDNVTGFLDKAIVGLNAFGDIMERIAESAMLDSLASLFHQLWTLAGNLFTIIGKLVGAFLGLDNVFTSVDTAGSAIIYGLSTALELVNSLLSKLIGSQGFAFALNLIAKIMSVLYSLIAVVATTIEAVINVFAKFISIVFNLDRDVLRLISVFGSLGSAIGKLIASLLSLFGVSKEVCDEIRGNVFGLFIHLGVKINALIGEFGNLFSSIKDGFADAPNVVAGGVKAMLVSIGALGAALISLISSVFGFDAGEVLSMLRERGMAIIDAVSNWFGNRAADLKELFSNSCTDIFSEFPNRFMAMIENFRSGSIGENVESALGFVGDCAKRGIERIIEAVEAVTGLDLSVFKSKVLDFLSGFADKLGELKPGFEKAWDKLVEIFWGLVDIFKGLADALFYVIGKATGIENMGPDKIIDLLFWVLDKLVGLFIWLASGFATVINTIGPGIIDALTLVKDFAGQCWSAFKYLIGVDDSVEASEALDRIVGVLKKVALVLIVLQVVKFFKAISWFLGGIGDIGDFLSGRSSGNILHYIEKMIRDIALVLIAIAILARQDPGHLAMAVIAMGLAMGMITKAMTMMQKQLVDFAKYIEKNSINEKSVNSAIKSISSVMSSIGKLIIRLTIALAVLTYFANTYGSRSMYTAVFALTTAIIVLVVGIKMLVKSTKGLDSEAKQLKRVGKLVGKVTSELSFISGMFYVLTKVISTIQKDNQNSTAVEGAIFLMVASVATLLAGTTLLVTFGKKLSPDQLKGVATNIAKVGLWTSLMGLALLAMVDLLDKQEGGLTLNAAFLKKLGICFGIMAGAITVMALGVGIMGKLTSNRTPKTVEKTTKNVAETALKLAALAVAFFGVMVSVSAIVGAVALFGLLVEILEPEVILSSLGYVVLTIAAIIGAFWLLSKFEIKSLARDILAFSVAMMAFAVAVGILAAALALVSLVGVSMEGTGAIIALGLFLLLFTGLGVLLSSFDPALKAILKFTGAMMLFSMAIMILIGSLMLLTLVDTEKIKEGVIAIGILMGMLVLLGAVVGMVPSVMAGVIALSAAVLALALAFGIFVLVAKAMGNVDDLLDSFVSGMESLTERIDEVVDSVVSFIAALLVALGESLVEHAEEIAHGLFMLLLAIVGIALELLDEIFGDALKPIIEEIGNFFASIGHGIVDLFWTIVDAIKSVYNGIKDTIIAIGNWIVDTATSIWNSVTGFLSMIWNGITNFLETIKNGFLTIIKFIISIPKTIWEGFKSAIEWLGGLIKTAFEKIWDFITAPFKAVWDLGKNIVTGLWEGIQDKFEWVKQKIKDFCGGVMDKIKDFFGINSPSKVMKEVIGENLMKGLANGITSGEGGVLDTVKNAGKGILNTFKDSVSGIGDVGSMLDGSQWLDQDTLTQGLGDLKANSLVVGGIDYSSFGTFDPEQVGLSSVYDMDVIAGYQGYGALDVATSFQPTIKDSQLEQISGAYEDNSQEIIGAINDLKAEMAHQSEIIGRFQMVLDTGVLVGELRDPMDKALGKSAKLATGRGI